MKLHRFIGRPAAAATALVFFGAISLTSTAMAQSHPPMPSAQAGPVKVLIIDRRMLMQGSNAGQDIAKQVNSLQRAAEAEFKGENDQLRHEGESLEQQVAILAPDVRDQKKRAFQAKLKAFQQKAQNRLIQIRYGYMLAERQVEQVAVPIVQQILQERGATLMIDRQATVMVGPGLDVTKAAIDRLNQKLPNVKVELATPPPDVLAQMQAAAAAQQQ
ncbi:MAG TPA: OmpH family outer membrane protein [Rhizomicrobium sp.]|nr:OmpH family outer membrane protein [Rhizomicrobium sp.]